MSLARKLMLRIYFKDGLTVLSSKIVLWCNFDKDVFYAIDIVKII